MTGMCARFGMRSKGKMAKEGVELVSITNHFKFEAPDGKQRLRTWIGLPIVTIPSTARAKRKLTISLKAAC